GKAAAIGWAKQDAARAPSARYSRLPALAGATGANLQTQGRPGATGANLRTQGRRQRTRCLGGRTHGSSRFPGREWPIALPSAFGFGINAHRSAGQQSAAITDVAPIRVRFLG